MSMRPRRFVRLRVVERYLQCTKGSIRVEYKQEGWRAEHLPTKELRAIDTDVKGYTIEKGGNLMEFTAQNREELMCGDTPLARDARERRPKPRIVVLRDPERGLYVLDGYSRTVAACLQGDPNIAAFILDEPDSAKIREKPSLAGLEIPWTTKCT